MKRTLVRQGGSTLTVALPSPWIKKHSLKPGDEIDIQESGPNLVVGSEELKRQKKIEVDLSGYIERMIRWTISALHKEGYDEISILFDHPRTVSIVNNMVKDLFTGFIVVEHTQKKLVLRNIAIPLESELNSILNRAFNVTLTLGEEIIRFIKEKNYKEIIHLISLENTNNQLTHQCERIINSRGFTAKDTFLYVIIWNLEKVCDSYKYICETLSQAKNFELDAKVIDVLQQINEFLRAYFHLFNNFNIKKANDIISHKSSFSKEIEILLSKSKGLNSIVLSYSMMAYLRIADFLPSTIALNI